MTGFDLSQTQSHLTGDWFGGRQMTPVDPIRVKFGNLSLQPREGALFFSLGRNLAPARARGQ